MWPGVTCSRCTGRSPSLTCRSVRQTGQARARGGGRHGFLHVLQRAGIDRPWLAHHPRPHRCRAANSHAPTPIMRVGTTGRGERPMRDPIVIIGGGMAGGNAAATLRDEGFSGPVVLLTREPGVPFGRPPLSKTYLRSEEDLAGWYVRPSGWYAEHDIELRNGVVVAAVDVAAHTVTLDSGAELRYEKVLIATGGRNRRIRADGADLPGIHYLRTVAECDSIKQEAVRGRTAVIVGMGFIGCAGAASLTPLGVRVPAIFPGQAPFERVLGDQVAGVMSAI